MSYMKINKNLITILCTLILVKTLLSLFILSPTIFSDEYVYFKLARSFYNNLTFTVHNIPIIVFPLYIIIISIANIFQDTILAYIITKIINALISSLIIIPAFLLAKEFFNEKKSLLIALAISLFPANFALSPYIMNENLFYPLFLTSFYFLFKTINNNSLKNNIMFGIFTSLAFLTKITGILLIFNFLLFTVFKKNYRSSKNLIPFIIFAVTLLAWIFFVTDLKLDNLTLENITAGNSRVITNYDPIGLFKSILLLFMWIMNYLFYILLSLFFILPLAPLIAFKDIKKNFKEKYLFSLSILFLAELILVLTFKNIRPVTDIFQKSTLFISWFTGSIMGRYIDTVIPLLILAGFIGLNHLSKKLNLKKYFIIAFIILILGSQALISSLLPIRNASLSWLGALNYVFSSIFNKYTVFFIGLLISIIILVASYHVLKKVDLNRILYIYIILFALVSLISLSITFYNSFVLTKNPYFEFSKEISNLIEKDNTLLIDEKYCLSRDIRESLCTKEIFSPLHSSLIGLWINSDIVVGNLNSYLDADYIVTHDKLDHNLLKKRGNLYLYKIEKPLLTRQPYLQNVTDNSIIISFKTALPTNTSVYYSTNKKDYVEVNSSEMTTHHFITLKNLDEGTKYFYKLDIDNYEISNKNYYFSTNNLEDEEINFVVFGDIGTEEGKQNYTALAISNLKNKPDLILITGDVIYPDGSSQYYDNHLFNYFKNIFMNTPVYPALGNHDWYTDPKSNFEKEWFLPGNEHYYSFDYGNAHFIILDGQEGMLYDTENQMKWLKKDLEINKNKKWKFVIVHHTGLTCTYKETNEGITNLYPILEKYDVDILFTGHAHTYERLYPLKDSNPINTEMEPDYINPSFITITTGAAGQLRENWQPKSPCNISAKLHNSRHFVQIKINDKKLEGTAIDSITGKVFDRFSSSKT